MFNADTGILVAGLTNEVRTDDAQQWLAEQSAGELAISQWVDTEFSAALSMKLRMGQLQSSDRAEVLSAFAQLVAESFHILPIGSMDSGVAARYADQHATGLRAGDALHLAIAANQGARIRTLDKRLEAAAESLGVSAALI